MTRRAVVLGAGGPAGIAWEVGVIAGLEDAGVDVRRADLFVGTSAGSVVATQITSGLATEKLFQKQVDADQQVRELIPPVDFNQLRADIARAKDGGGGVPEMLRRVGLGCQSAGPVGSRERSPRRARAGPEHRRSCRLLTAACNLSDHIPGVFTLIR
jgi:NTE family protein